MSDRGIGQLCTLIKQHAVRLGAVFAEEGHTPRHFVAPTVLTEQQYANLATTPPPPQRDNEKEKEEEAADQKDEPAFKRIKAENLQTTQKEKEEEDQPQATEDQRSFIIVSEDRLSAEKERVTQHETMLNNLCPTLKSFLCDIRWPQGLTYKKLSSGHVEYVQYREISFFSGLSTCFEILQCIDFSRYRHTNRGSTYVLPIGKAIALDDKGTYWIVASITEADNPSIIMVLATNILRRDPLPTYVTAGGTAAVGSHYSSAASSSAYGGSPTGGFFEANTNINASKSAGSLQQVPSFSTLSGGSETRLPFQSQQQVPSPLSQSQQQQQQFQPSTTLASMAENLAVQHLPTTNAQQVISSGESKAESEHVNIDEDSSDVPLLAKQEPTTSSSEIEFEGETFFDNLVAQYLEHFLAYLEPEGEGELCGAYDDLDRTFYSLEEAFDVTESSKRLTSTSHACEQTSPSYPLLQDNPPSLMLPKPSLDEPQRTLSHPQSVSPASSNLSSAAPSISSASSSPTTPAYQLSKSPHSQGLPFPSPVAIAAVTAITTTSYSNSRAATEGIVKPLPPSTTNTTITPTTTTGLGIGQASRNPTGEGAREKSSADSLQLHQRAAASVTTGHENMTPVNHNAMLVAEEYSSVGDSGSTPVAAEARDQTRLQPPRSSLVEHNANIDSAPSLQQPKGEAKEEGSGLATEAQREPTAETRKRKRETDNESSQQHQTQPELEQNLIKQLQPPLETSQRPSNSGYVGYQQQQPPNQQYSTAYHPDSLAPSGGGAFGVSTALQPPQQRNKTGQPLVERHPVKILRLNLNKQHLRSLPPQIGLLRYLRSLNLKRNRLTELPEEFGMLDHLQHLVLSFNCLASLPHSIGNLKQLRMLDIHSNNLTYLPESFVHLSALEYLCLSYNKLRYLPKQFGDYFPKLEFLNLESNQLTSMRKRFPVTYPYCNTFKRRYPPKQLDYEHKKKLTLLHANRFDFNDLSQLLLFDEKKHAKLVAQLERNQDEMFTSGQFERDYEDEGDWEEPEEEPESQNELELPPKDTDSSTADQHKSVANTTPTTNDKLSNIEIGSSPTPTAVQQDSTPTATTEATAVLPDADSNVGRDGGGSDTSNQDVDGRKGTSPKIKKDTEQEGQRAAFEAIEQLASLAAASASTTPVISSTVGASGKLNEEAVEAMEEEENRVNEDEEDNDKNDDEEENEQTELRIDDEADGEDLVENDEASNLEFESVESFGQIQSYRMLATSPIAASALDSNKALPMVVPMDEEEQEEEDAIDQARTLEEKNKLVGFPFIVNKRGCLPSLVTLRLGNNRLSEFPRNLCEYVTTLKELNLSRNRIAFIPKNINNLKQLRILYIGSNCIEHLPTEIGDLEELYVLDVRSDFLPALPATLPNLKKLEVLYLNRNGLRGGMPSVLFHMFSLRKLDLNFIRLMELPPEIGLLENLEILQLRETMIKHLPIEITLLTRLTDLDLSLNNMTLIPEEVLELDNLRTLEAMYNNLTELPSNIGWKLTRLKNLDVSHNKLSKLPDSLSNLKDLRQLDLSCNKLPHIPEGILKLPHLKFLSFGYNKLSNEEKKALKKRFRD
ncbi:Leucine rich repeat domain containing protein [Balamuthia mandrillaris]